MAGSPHLLPLASTERSTGKPGDTRDGEEGGRCTPHLHPAGAQQVNHPCIHLTSPLRPHKRFPSPIPLVSGLAVASPFIFYFLSCTFFFFQLSLSCCLAHKSQHELGMHLRCAEAKALCHDRSWHKGQEETLRVEFTEHLLLTMRELQLLLKSYLLGTAKSHPLGLWLWK